MKHAESPTVDCFHTVQLAVLKRGAMCSFWTWGTKSEHELGRDMGSCPPLLLERTQGRRLYLSAYGGRTESNIFDDSSFLRKINIYN